MKLILTGAAALALLSSTARADEPKKTDHESVTGAAHEALEEKADAPKAPGTLPDEASATAKARSHGQRGDAMKKLHSESRESDRTEKDAKGDARSDKDSDAAAQAANHGRRVRDRDDGRKTRDHGDGKGDGEADKDSSTKHGDKDAESARADAANQSARGASDATSKEANGDAHSAAGQARASEKRGDKTPGSSSHGH